MILRLLPLLLLLPIGLGAVEPRPRLLVLTDIGGDPDDTQSMVRLMVYANEFEIEGLVASSAGIIGQLKVPVVRPDIIHEVIGAYGQVRGNLARHASGWPEPADLLQTVKAGNPRRGRDFIGEAHDTEGSRWIIERVDAGTPARLLNITIWGGQTDFAQALWRVKQERGAKGLTEFVARLRVFGIGDQDRIADWIQTEFPGLFYIISSAPPGFDRRLGTFRGMYLGGDESLTSQEWIAQNVLSRGPLGGLYPTRTNTKPNPHGCLKEGDTPAWFFFLPCGGNNPADPSQPGWGGQYRKAEDGWWRDLPISENFDPRETVSRWRPQFQADFARRIGWCVAE